MSSSQQTGISKSEQLLLIAQRLAEASGGFFLIQGPGQGNRLTNAYMDALNKLAATTFGVDHSQKHLCPGTGFCVDFYFPDEGTIVEIALSARNPTSEYERDLFKAILAKEAGHNVARLIFVSRPGASRKLNEPGPKAIRSYVARIHLIDSVIEELVSDDSAAR